MSGEEKPNFTVVIKRRPKIPKDLLIYFTPETKVELVKSGYARGYVPEPTAKPHKKGK